MVAPSRSMIGREVRRPAMMRLSTVAAALVLALLVQPSSQVVGAKPGLSSSPRAARTRPRVARQATALAPEAPTAERAMRDEMLRDEMPTRVATPSQAAPSSAPRGRPARSTSTTAAAKKAGKAASKGGRSRSRSAASNGVYTAAEERDLVRAAQFFVENQARRRLLQCRWGRTPTDYEWAAASITFNYVDSDGNGRMDAQELVAMCGKHMDRLCPEIFDAFDENGEGYLDFEAYAKLTAKARVANQPDAPAAGGRRRGKARSQLERDEMALSDGLCTLTNDLAQGDESTRVADFHAQLERGSAALKFLIRANQGMVHQIVRQLKPKSSRYDIDDMLQDGNMGLMQAIVRFDPASGCRLSTYAFQWIRGLVMTGLHRRLNQVNLPQVVAQDVFKLKKLLRESSRTFVTVADDELLSFAKQLNWNEDRLQKTVRASRVDTTHVTSLQSVVSHRDGADFTLGDTVTSPTSPVTVDFRMTLEAALASRAERNAHIIRLRFGLEDGVEHTYTQIAEKVGLSPQRVCNVVNQELRFLKDARALRAFEDGLEYSHQ